MVLGKEVLAVALLLEGLLSRNVLWLLDMLLLNTVVLHDVSWLHG